MTVLRMKKVTVVIIIVCAAVIASLLAVNNKPRSARLWLKTPASIHQNEAIIIPLYLNTVGTTINAAEVYIRFDPSLLEVQSVSKEGSFFTLWIDGQPRFSNIDGTISFAGGIPNPGYSDEGIIGKVTFKARQSGNTRLQITDESRILKNDGIGTVVPLQSQSQQIRIR
jgi:hypothetical protein